MAYISWANCPFGPSALCWVDPTTFIDMYIIVTLYISFLVYDTYDSQTIVSYLGNINYITIFHVTVNLWFVIEYFLECCCYCLNSVPFGSFLSKKYK